MTNGEDIFKKKYKKRNFDREYFFISMEEWK